MKLFKKFLKIMQVFIRRTVIRSIDEVNFILVSRGWKILTTCKDLRSLTKIELEVKYNFTSAESDKILSQLPNILANRETICLEVTEETTVDELKIMTSRKTGVSPEAMRFIYSGKQMQDGHKLSYYKIYPSDTIHWFARLRGD